MSKDKSGFNVSSDMVEVDEESEVDRLLMDRVSDADRQSEVICESELDWCSEENVSLESGKHWVTDVLV